MQKYAVIKLGGTQVMVSPGDIFEIERQHRLTPKVLMYSDGDTTLIGEPEVVGVKVKASKVEDKLDKKVVVARYKSKSRYRRKKGHRQPITVVKIDSIDLVSAKKETSKSDDNKKESKQKASSRSGKTKKQAVSNKSVKVAKEKVVAKGSTASVSGSGKTKKKSTKKKEKK